MAKKPPKTVFSPGDSCQFMSPHGEVFGSKDFRVLGGQGKYENEYSNQKAF